VLWIAFFLASLSRLEIFSASFSFDSISDLLNPNRKERRISRQNYCRTILESLSAESRYNSPAPSRPNESVPGAVTAQVWRSVGVPGAALKLRSQPLQ
jgi:hypothetical protein